MKKLCSIFLLFVLILQISAKPISWYSNTTPINKEATWYHKDITWYHTETSWYRADYHWAEITLDKDLNKFISNIEKVLSRIEFANETAKRERLDKLHSEALKKFGIGASILAVEIALVIVGGPVVKSIALTAMSGSVRVGVTGLAINAIFSVAHSIAEGKSDDEIISTALASGADGFMIGTIVGGVYGAISNIILQPNRHYTSNGYAYTTDKYGRIIEAGGKLRLEDGVRNREAQKLVGGATRLTTDDGGHLIGNRFGGSGDLCNLVPMNSNINRGAYKRLENGWAKALENGSDVKVKIYPQYELESKRPVSFKITEVINGIKKIHILQNP